MKRIFIVSAILICAAGYSQSVKPFNSNSQFAVPGDQLPVKVDFSYYAKNYDKVFGEFNYTNNANDVSPRSVYVGYNGVFYYQGNSTYITEVPSNWPTYNIVGYQDVIGGIKNLASLFSSEKDYSIKK